jgi:hypothetical protein
MAFDAAGLIVTVAASGETVRIRMTGPAMVQIRNLAACSIRPVISAGLS